MKLTHLLVLTFLLLTSSPLWAQSKSNGSDSILFHTQYSPQTVYVMSMNMHMAVKTGLDSSGQSATGSQGQEMNSQSEMTLTTGASGAGNKIPVVMEITKMNTGAGAPNLAGMKYYGNSIGGGLPHIDSVSQAMDTGSTAQMVKAVNAMLNQFDLPNIKMAVGQSYTQTTPMALPLGGGMSIKMNTSVTYILKSVQGNLANFDMKMKIDMDVASSSLPAGFAGSGLGEGAMVYNLNTQFYESSHLSDRLIMSINQGSTPMRIALDQVTDIHCTATPAVH